MEQRFIVLLDLGQNKKKKSRAKKFIIILINTGKLFRNEARVQTGEELKWLGVKDNNRLEVAELGTGMGKRLHLITSLQRF